MTTIDQPRSAPVRDVGLDDRPARRPRIVAFLLADDERRPDYVSSSSTSDGVTHDVVPGPALPVPVIIAARIGLLAAGVALVASTVVAVMAAAAQIGA